ncbi:unnamed protein product [Closterium sp. NIES-54]
MRPRFHRAFGPQPLSLPPGFTSHQLVTLDTGGVGVGGAAAVSAGARGANAGGASLGGADAGGAGFGGVGAGGAGSGGIDADGAGSGGTDAGGVATEGTDDGGHTEGVETALAAPRCLARLQQQRWHQLKSQQQPQQHLHPIPQP